MTRADSAQGEAKKEDYDKREEPSEDEERAWAAGYRRGMEDAQRAVCHGHSDGDHGEICKQIARAVLADADAREEKS